MARILIVEDDGDMAAGLRDNLQFDGHDVLHATTGPSGIKRAHEESPDLILLDVMLPELDGFAVCQRIRQTGNTVPIIMLTARSQEIDIVRGLELGADDYVTKPFGLRELSARITAALRRSRGDSDRKRSFQLGQAHVDLDRGRVVRADQTFVLGHYEIEILNMLFERAEQNVPRAELLGTIWGYSALPTDRSVDNHIVSLRRKIEINPKKPEHILTVHGIGYKLVP